MVSLGLNVSALKIQRQLNERSVRIGQSYQRLSSGTLLSRASDDPAGLMMADSLRLQARLARAAIRNTSDGLSALSIADAALGSIGEILTRMQELAAQAANGSYSQRQRESLQAEFSSLGSEIERLAASTRFNGIGLLAGGGDFTVQVGTNGAAGSALALPSVDASLTGLGLGEAGELTYSLLAASGLESQESARSAVAAVKHAVEGAAVKRGMLGAMESRLGFALENLASYENVLLEAEARISDVDVAAEVAELVRMMILQQVGAVVLQYALQEPQLVLLLLR